MLTTLKTVVTLCIFLVYWLQLALPIKGLKVGRTVISLLSGSLMVTLSILTPTEALSSISSNTLLLLFGLMVILAKLETKGLNVYLKSILLFNSPSPRTLLVRVSLLSSVLAAFIMNDGAAIFLTGVVMDIVEEFDLLVEPFAMAVATSSNLGSASTVLGNPKNMVVEENYPDLTFLKFSSKMAPPALIATILNTIFLHFYYYSELDSLPLITNLNKRTSKPKLDLEFYDDIDDDLDRLSLDSDVLDLERQYLDSKMYTQDMDFNTLSLLTPIDNDNVNRRTDSPTYCARLTETPNPYRTISFDEEDTFNYTNFQNTNYGSLRIDTSFLPTNSSAFVDGVSKSSVLVDDVGKNSALVDDDGKSSILSPALSFKDFETNLDLRTTPTYSWPTVPTHFRKRKFNFGNQELEQGSTGMPRLNLESDIRSDKSYPLSSIRSSPKLQHEVQIEDTVHRFQLILIFLILIVMYVGFVLKFPLGWTCLTAALLILLVDNQDSSHLISEQVNWNLLVYLSGTFILLKGVQLTNLNKFMVGLAKPTLTSHNLGNGIKIITFLALILTLSFMFTSIPTVLMVLPYLKDLEQDNSFFKNIYFLLAWAVTLTGNLMPFGSVAGLIVSEMSKDYCTEQDDIEEGTLDEQAFQIHTNLNLKGEVRRRKSKNRWIGDFKVWSKFAIWSTTILLVVGAFLVCWE